MALALQGWKGGFPSSWCLNKDSKSEGTWLFKPVGSFVDDSTMTSLERFITGEDEVQEQRRRPS